MPAVRGLMYRSTTCEHRTRRPHARIPLTQLPPLTTHSNQRACRDFHVARAHLGGGQRAGQVLAQVTRHEPRQRLQEGQAHAQARGLRRLVKRRRAALHQQLLKLHRATAAARRRRRRGCRRL